MVGQRDLAYVVAVVMGLVVCSMVYFHGRPRGTMVRRSLPRQKSCAPERHDNSPQETSISGNVESTPPPPMLHEFVFLDQLRKAVWNYHLWTKEPGQEYSLCAVDPEFQELLLAVCEGYGHANCSVWFPCSVVKSSGSEKIPCPPSQVKECSIRCSGSTSLERLKNPQGASLIFNGQFHYTPRVIEALRKFRKPGNVWIYYFVGENVAYYPQAGDRDFLSLMDLSIGYTRDFYDVPVLGMTSMKTLQNLPPLPEQRNGTAIVTAFISNCKDKSRRTQLLEGLMKAISVDSFGSCLKNKDIPARYGTLMKQLYPNLVPGSWDYRFPEKELIIRDYKFTVAIENALTNDYVSEKLWEPLISGSVPIYLGAPNVNDYLPCASPCIIDVRNYASMEQLATHLKFLDSRPDEYAKLHEWRKQPYLRNIRHLLKGAEFVGENHLSPACLLVQKGQTRESIRHQVGLSDLI